MRFREMIVMLKEWELDYIKKSIGVGEVHTFNNDYQIMVLHRRYMVAGPEKKRKNDFYVKPEFPKAENKIRRWWWGWYTKEDQQASL